MKTRHRHIDTYSKYSSGRISSSTLKLFNTEFLKSERTRLSFSSKLREGSRQFDERKSVKTMKNFHVNINFLHY